MKKLNTNYIIYILYKIIKMANAHKKMTTKNKQNKALQKKNDKST